MPIAVPVPKTGSVPELARMGRDSRDWRKQRTEVRGGQCRYPTIEGRQL
jgi:hypothetical protein